MMFFVTVMAGLLYGLLGVLHPGLLGLRLAETAAGALGAVLAVALILPVTTHAVTDRWVARAVHAVHDCTSAAARRLAGDPGAHPAPSAAELEALLGRVRFALAPLVHPLNPMRARKARARQVLALLDDCARELRGLSSLGEVRHAPTPPGTAPRRVVAEPEYAQYEGTAPPCDAPHRLRHKPLPRRARERTPPPRDRSAAVTADPAASHDARLTAACGRVEAAVEVLVGAVPERAVPSGAGMSDVGLPGRDPGAEQALAHLHGLERALAALAAPLRDSSTARA